MSRIKETKKLLQSKTIWGIILMVVGFVGSKFGLTIQEADLKEILDLVFNGIAGVGALIATYGRIKATKAIK